MKRLFPFGLILLTHSFFSQDLFFTQYDKCLLLINPSSSGNFDGFERFSTQHKNQWVGSGTSFASTLGSAELTFGKNKFDDRSYLSAGMHFIRDVGGDARFGTSALGSTLSGHLVTSPKTRISAGIQLSYTNRSGNFSQLQWYSQWNGTAFDPSIPVNEPTQAAKYSYLDASVGLSFTLIDKESRVGSGRMNALNIGVFMQHLNRPKLRYNDITLDRLYAKAGGHVESELTLNRLYSIELKMLQMFQGKHYMGRYGAFLKTKLKRTAEVTRLKNDAFISLGCYGSSTGTLSPTVLLDFGGVQLGFNYDVELGRMSRAYRSSLEFTFSYAFTKQSMFNSRRFG
ncbi:MAG: PorP/SprF family type IX secretion system membrane protein [Bacteroidetes bacterium]|nr:PorP/SprF family type IX secretion system membrane protein [Bacteroidota bacterium]